MGLRQALRHFVTAWSIGFTGLTSAMMRYLEGLGRLYRGRVSPNRVYYLKPGSGGWHKQRGL